MSAITHIVLRGLLSPPIAQSRLEFLYQDQGRAWGQKLGWWAHVVLGIAACFCLAGPITAIEIGPWVVFGCAVLRVHTCWRGYLQLLRLPLVGVILACVAWIALSLLWSGDLRKGVQELGNARWVPLVFVLWPVIHRRAWLIGGLIAGLIAGQLTQVLEWVGHEYGISGLLWPHPRNPLPVPRISGWWHHPVMGGIILVAVLGLHLPPAFFGNGWRRVAGCAGCIAAFIGALATGSRGSWIASLALVAIVAVFAATRHRVRLSTRRILIAFAVIVCTVGPATILLRNTITQRLHTASQEMRLAVKDGDRSSDVGARIQYALWALEMISERPLQGFGAGSYESWVRSSLAQQGIDPATQRIAPQAHNTILHAWATLGVPGACLVILVFGVGIASGIVAAKSHAKILGNDVDWAGLYVAGPPCALLGVAIMSCFDTIYVNVQPAAFTTGLLALCLPLAPRFGVCFSDHEGHPVGTVDAAPASSPLSPVSDNAPKVVSSPVGTAWKRVGEKD